MGVWLWDCMGIVWEQVSIDEQGCHVQAIHLFSGGHHAVRKDSIFAGLEDDCSSPKHQLCQSDGTGG